MGCGGRGERQRSGKANQCSFHDLVSALAQERQYLETMVSARRAEGI
jgi:hypothetical protein